ncbi:hypothetical protein D9757_000051 [Collybiopsis confluens]|uniref:Actin cytoskeleton-regulatory complex protein SLA1 n=1 Tax=Collybiopsis confluens TaxID=2823264 RepID=A0A8H5I1T6_9AGAR|nr:hypothetical protein D9757_000051 [Collybiopsis confluens]
MAELEYLAVLKASYDYEPQSDDEIAIKENQLLFLKERTDEDWWKVKIKGEFQEEDTPTGLVPAAYVEQAEHTSVVKALYDYQGSASGELTIAEDELLFAFDTEEEWMLVQSTKENGKAGYVPANYVETHTGEEGETKEEEKPVQQIIVPPSPTSPPPSAPYVDPADRVASTKVNPDDIKTWSVSEVDKKGKKMKGTLGIGSGAVFFASETSKAAVQKWPAKTINNITVEKSKHVHFDVEGGVSLHFNVGSKDNCDAIVTKLESSRSLDLQSSKGNTTTTTSPIARAPSPPAIDTISSKAVKSLRFAPESPAIIPVPSEHSSEEGEEQQGEVAVALYPFTADGDDELSVTEGEQLVVIEKDGDEWWKCRNAEGTEGVVPASYIELSSTPAAHVQRMPIADAVAVQDYEEEEPEDDAEDVSAKEEAAAERARKEEEEENEKERKKKEVQARAKAAEAERIRRTKAAQVARPSPPPVTPSRSASGKDRPTSSKSNDNGFPPAERVRVWHDRTGQFRVEAALLSFKDGKLRLHKINGVIVEVPSEKMSVEDMRYVDKLLSRKSRPLPGGDISEDDIPLALQRPSSSNGKTPPAPKASQPKKSPSIDWFDFFLTAGCDLDDCTRYTSSFERDKMDATIIPDITESVLRSLGLKEGDIIRVMKVIEKHKPKPTQDKMARDEELAKELQARENGDSGKGPRNLFANGPNGELKTAAPRRGRPQPSKSLPAAVDLNTIVEVSGKIQRTGSPSLLSPASAGTPIQPPPRSSSTASGFDDDAWTNRPSSTKPIAPTPSAAVPRAPSAPPAQVTPTSASAQAPPAPTPPNPPSSAPVMGPPSLAKTTEEDVFQQLARLSELRKNTAPPAIVSPTMGTPSPVPTPPIMPAGYQSGMGMGNSPVPMGQHIQNQQTGVYGNGPRGPYAPVPTNQGLLQPLIPTQTGFGGFVPTRSAGSNLSPQSFLQSQPTGFPGGQPHLSQLTGFVGSQPLITQATGMPFAGLNAMNDNGMNAVNPFGLGGVMTNPTGFNPGMDHNFNAGMSMPPPPPVPPLPATQNNTTNPATIFAQMKSGTFANEGSLPQSANHYDALRAQPTGWGGLGGSYTGYRQ